MTQNQQDRQKYNLMVFEKQFKRGMINKDFEQFKRTHPTLLKCIVRAMDELTNNQY